MIDHAKIAHYTVTVRIQLDVLWKEATEEEPLAMAVVDCQEQLANQEAHPLLRETGDIGEWQAGWIIDQEHQTVWRREGFGNAGNERVIGKNKGCDARNHI
jgi:hypothetical protein